MPIGRKPPAEISIDLALVRALLQEQHTDLAHLVLSDVGEGWDNRLFGLGDDLVVRVPRRAVSAALIEQEQRWLPRLSPQLPLPVPVPRRVGRPGRSTSRPLSKRPTIPGEACHWPLARASCITTCDKRTGSSTDARCSSFGSVQFQSRPGLDRRCGFMATCILVNHGRLSAVIDFGDLAAGDPAADLSVMWMLLPPSTRPVLRASAHGEFNPVDDLTLMRPRGWALALGLAYLGRSHDDEAMRTLGLRTIEAALSND